MPDPEIARSLRLLRPLDRARDHVRGGVADEEDGVTVIAYQDFLCPYCRRARPIFSELRKALGDRLRYTFRHFPKEATHPGATLAARAAEAAGLQGRFWEMHDAIFDHELPIAREQLDEMAHSIGLDVARFNGDLDSDATGTRVADDVAAGRENGVTATPTMFVDGVRYDGAWDFHSMLEALKRPFAARLHRSARVFASLPTSAGLVLLIAAVLAIVCANTPLAPLYERVMTADVLVGPIAHPLSLTLREWISDGLLAFFFLIVGLEIRRELTVGSLANRRAVILPVTAAIGGVIMPALIYLLVSSATTSRGWPIPTATDVAFCLGLLAVLGDRVPTSLRAFVAALAVADDLATIATLAIVFPSAFTPIFLVPVAACVVMLIVLNRGRVYATWPYVVTSLALWLSLHALGVDGALAGVVLAIGIPTRPAPSPAPLLAQAAEALAALDAADDDARREGRESRLEDEPVWEWAARNLSATTERLLSPAERIEQAVAPWSAFIILPLFAFSATGVSFAVDLSSSDAKRVFVGTLAGLAVGKPLGILCASSIVTATGVTTRPAGVSLRQFVGAAFLCGIGDTLALLMADRAFDEQTAAVAKLGMLAGSVVAALVGLALLRTAPAAPATL